MNVIRFVSLFNNLELSKLPQTASKSLTLGIVGQHLGQQLPAFLAIVFLVLIAGLTQSAAQADSPQAPTPNHGYSGTTLTRISFAASAFARTADTALTCQTLSQPGGHEVGLPVHSCGGVAAWNFGTVGVAYGGQAVMHKLGWHKCESIPHWISAAGSIAGIVYTATHTARRKPETVGPLPPLLHVF